MANVVISPNMNLPIPVVGQDAGPDWANNVNNCLGITGGGIDGHNHTSGNGVQIPPGGLNINADLPFNSNNATLLKTIRFVAQVSPIGAVAPNLGCLYVAGVDLYYNDESGNQVRLTASGSVNATSSGISSGTATASFVGGVLVVDSATNTPGNIQGGSISIGDNTSGSNFVTISAPSSLAANYNYTLPSGTPASNGAFLTSATSGALGYTNVDNSTLIISSNILQIPSSVNLPGKAAQEANKNIIVSNSNATNSLAIIRGIVAPGGTIAGGEGFTVSLSSTGTYSLIWTNAFTDTPSVVVTLDGITSPYIVSASGSTLGSIVYITNTSNVASNQYFQFIAIGQRT